MKSFKQFINEQTDVLAREEEILATNAGYEDDEEANTVREAFTAIIAALVGSAHKVGAKEKEALDNLLEAGLLTQDEYYRALAGIVPGTESAIVSLTEWNDVDGAYEVVGHPDLETSRFSDIDEFDYFYGLLEFLNKFPSETVWEDPEWAGTPGGSWVTLYSIPAEDGGTIKVATWYGSNWEYIEVFINRADLTRRIKR